MLKQMGVTNPDALTCLRYRGNGWPGQTIAEIPTHKGVERRELVYDKAWGGILQKYRQWRCMICPDHTGEYADISVGDPWYRKIEESEQGQSLILVRTQRGKEVLEKAMLSGYLVAKKIDAAVLEKSQPHLSNARSRLWGQLLGLRLAGAACPQYKGFDLKRLWQQELSLEKKVRSIGGTILRVVKRKINRRVTY